MNAGSQDTAGEADGVHHHDQKDTNDQSVPIVSLSVSDEYSASAAEEDEDEEDDYLDDSFEEQPDSGAGGDTIISSQKGAAVAQNDHENAAAARSIVAASKALNEPPTIEDHIDDDDDSSSQSGNDDKAVAMPSTRFKPQPQTQQEFAAERQDQELEEEEQFMEIELDEQDDDEETKFDQMMNMDPAELQRNTIPFAGAISQESIHTQSTIKQNHSYHQQQIQPRNQPMSQEKRPSLQQRTMVRKSANDAMRQRRLAPSEAVDDLKVGATAALSPPQVSIENDERGIYIDHGVAEDSVDKEEGDDEDELEASIEEEFVQELASLVPHSKRNTFIAAQDSKRLTNETEIHASASVAIPQQIITAGGVGGGLSHQASFDQIGEQVMAMSNETDTIQSQSTRRRKTNEQDQLKLTRNSFVTKHASSKGKSIKVRNHMQDRNRSKESGSVILHPQPTGGVGNRNMKKASFKSLKFIDTAAEGRSNNGGGGNKDTQSAASISHQDQYSSHKVLMSGKQIGINFDQQQVSGAGAAGSSANPSATKSRQLSKQKQKLKGQHQQTASKFLATATEGSEASNLLHKSGVAVQQAATNKRGSSNCNHMAVAPAAAIGPQTQKQTKSKARMIRNILQSSNINTEKKQQNQHSKSLIEQQQDQLQQSMACAPPISWFKLIEAEPLPGFREDEQKVDQAFNEMFQELIQNAAAPTSEQYSQDTHAPQETPQESQRLFEIELNLRRAQARQKYQTERQNLKSNYSKFESQQKEKLACLQVQQASLNKILSAIERKAQYEIDYVQSREHTRIWRNVNKLSLSWVSSILVEAEKSRQFALFKTQNSLEQIVFTAHEFPEPRKVSQRQSNNKESLGVKHITRDRFSDFQAQEVYKFFSRLPSSLQFMVDFRLKPFNVTKSMSLTNTEVTITSENLNSQKRQNVKQSVLDLAKQQAGKSVSLDASHFEATPIAVITASQGATASDERTSSFLEFFGNYSKMPSPFQALSGSSDLLVAHPQSGGYLGALKSKQILRANESLVSNQALDVLQATSLNLSANRYVYVCLKEAHSMDIELPKHAEMMTRIHQNKTMGRLYDNAMPIAQALKKIQQRFPPRERTQSAACRIIKPIKGLSQVKVEFQEQPKIFGVLAEVDLSILKQSREYADFFMPAPSEAAALIQSGAPQGVSLYVIETGQAMGKTVRQLQTFEVLFLLQQHLRLSKPIKLLEFTLNQADFASQKTATASGAAGPQDSNLKARVKAVAESRNSITIGSVHQDDGHQPGADDMTNRDLIIETTRNKNNELNQDAALAEEQQSTSYIVIDERCQESRKLQCRYIVKTLRKQSSGQPTPGKSSFQEALDKEDYLTAQQAKSRKPEGEGKEKTLCIWPNCLQTTDFRSTLATLQAIHQVMMTAQKEASISANLQSFQASSINMPMNQSSGVTVTRKNRPDSAYRHKQNQSQQVSQVNPEKVVSKRINRLRIALELDMADNLYSRFIKKGKAVKSDKTGGSGHQAYSNNKTRASWSQNQYSSQAGRIADAASLAPVLSTITAPSGLSQSLISAIGVSPFFTRLCPWHQRLERFLAQRFNISLMPNGPLNPNAFLKGLRVFENWRSETKTALMNDLFSVKANAGAGGNGGETSVGMTVMSDTLSRIYGFALMQIAQVGGPDIVSLIQTLQQIPKSINYPEKFFTWIENFTRNMSPLMVKNSQFNDAVTHFQFQLAPLSANLKQVKLNEDFIGVELTKWLNFCNQQQNSSSALKRADNAGQGGNNSSTKPGATAVTPLTVQQVSYLLNNFGSLQKILSVSDVIHRFTFFQQFINKMNTFGAAQQQQQQRAGTPQQLSNQPAGGGVSQQHQQPPPLLKNNNHLAMNLTKTNSNVTKHAGYRGVLTNTNQQQVIQAAKKNAKANLLPYATATSQQDTADVLDSNNTSAAKNLSQHHYHHTETNELLHQSSSTMQQSGNVQHHLANSSTLDKITAIYGGISSNPYTSSNHNLQNHMRKTTSTSHQQQQQMQHHTNASATSTHGMPTPKNQQIMMMSSDGFLAQKKYSQQLSQEISAAGAGGAGNVHIQPQPGSATATTTNLFQQSANKKKMQQPQNHQQQSANNFSSSLVQAAVASSSQQQSAIGGLFEYYHQPTSLMNQQLTSNNSVGPATAMSTTNHQQPHHQLIQINSTSTAQRLKARSNRGGAGATLQSSSGVIQPKSSAGAGNSRIGGVAHQSAEQVMMLSRSSPKKRMLSKGGGSAAGGNHLITASHQSVVVATSSLQHPTAAAAGGHASSFNFQPAQQVLHQSRDLINEQQSANLPAYHSMDMRKQPLKNVAGGVMNGSTVAAAAVAESQNLTSLPLTTQLTDISEQQQPPQLPQPAGGYMVRQGYQTQTGAFLKSSEAVVLQQIQPTTTTAAASSGNGSGSMLRITHQKQRAASAKKELIATYSTGIHQNPVQHPKIIGGSGKSHQHQQHQAHHHQKQHWSMQPSSFGAALTQEAFAAAANPGQQSKEQINVPARYSLVSATNYHAVGAHPAQASDGRNSLIQATSPGDQQPSASLPQQVPITRYQSNHHQASSAMTNLVGVQTSKADVTKNRSGDKKAAKLAGRQRKESVINASQQSSNAAGVYTGGDKQYIVVAGAARYDSSVGFVQSTSNPTAGGVQSASHRDNSSNMLMAPKAITTTVTRQQPASNLTKKNSSAKQQHQPPRAPPQLVDTKVNYQSGIRIINSVLTPNNVPRSAVTAKSHTNKSVKQQQQSAAAQLQSASKEVNVPIIRNITSAGGGGYPQSAKQLQMAQSTYAHQPASSSHQQQRAAKVGSFQAIDAQMTSGANSKVVTQQLMNMHKTNSEKAAHLQVTYANAMPRLASANAYLTKQSRKLRPSNLTGSVGNSHQSNRNTMFSEQQPAAASSAGPSVIDPQPATAGGHHQPHVKNNPLFAVSSNTNATDHNPTSQQ